MKNPPYFCTGRYHGSIPRDLPASWKHELGRHSNPLRHEVGVYTGMVLSSRQPIQVWTGPDVA